MLCSFFISWFMVLLPSMMFIGVLLLRGHELDFSIREQVPVDRRWQIINPAFRAPVDVLGVALAAAVASPFHLSQWLLWCHAPAAYTNSPQNKTWAGQLGDAPSVVRIVASRRGAGAAVPASL